MKSHFLKENDVVLSSRWQFQKTQEWGKRLLRNWEAERPGGSERGQGLRARIGSALRVWELQERGGGWGF